MEWLYEIPHIEDWFFGICFFVPLLVHMAHVCFEKQLLPKPEYSKLHNAFRLFRIPPYICFLFQALPPYWPGALLLLCWLILGGIFSIWEWHYKYQRSKIY